jgi:hypothetical protein
MIKMIVAVITAAACAGLIVTFVPGFAPESAAGATQSAAHSEPSTAAVETEVVEVIPTAADIRAATDIRRAVEQNSRNGSLNPKIVCEYTWPYYEPSCLRDGRAATGGTRVVRVIITDRSASGRTAPARR